MRYSGQNGINVTITDEVLTTFASYRQTSQNKKEAGGQLFATFDNGDAIIREATVPSLDDKRGRFFFLPNRWKERKEIQNRHSQGLHYVGDWHTHPENNPLPSQQDLRSISNCFEMSTHQLNFFFMIIVGKSDFPAGLHVSINTGEYHQVLSTIIAEQIET
jgi:integrative and conjugative element protein (TIGR02256 family)